MQIHCTYCQTMFAIGHEETLAALQHMEQHKQKYYDAHCPKCRRANRVERLKLELASPNWKTEIKALAKAAAAEEKSAEAASKVEPKTAPPAAAKKPASPKKPAAKATGEIKKK
jgi:hypothetical protein